MASNVKPSRTLLVTGASSGIGRAVVERMLAGGHVVIGVARDFSKAALSHPRFHAEALDLAELGNLPAQLKRIIHDYPDIDGVICGAGRGQFGSLEEFSYRQIADLIDINFTSQVYVARGLLPVLKGSGRGGDLVFIGSEAALSGGRRGAVYSATKFALRGLVQALRDECARSGVRVTLINPGMVKTAFFDELHFEPGQEDTNYVLPTDVADAVALVLSARPGTVFDQINLSPLKKVVRFGKKDTGGPASGNQNP